MSLLLALYRTGSSLLFPLVMPYLRKGHSVGWGERCGLYSDDKRALFAGAESGRSRKNIWIHSVSVGEVQAASPLAELSLSSDGGHRVIVSTVTETGARTVERTFGKRVVHVYAPWDSPSIVRSACDALKPTVYIAVETEIWPNILSELNARKIPALLINGRVSDRTWKRVQSSSSARSFLRDTYNLFDRIFARTTEDAERMYDMGIAEELIHVAGDCKVDAVLNRKRSSVDAVEELRRKLSPDGSAPCFVAGSTHAGEDEVVLEAFAALRSGSGAVKSARLIIAPRHPERADAVRTLAERFGRVSFFSELDSLSDGDMPDIVVVDVIGVLFELYGLALSVFIGGSLVPNGGQNILEPASWGIPVLHGPHMDDFAEPTARLDEDRCSYTVHSAGEIESLWRRAVKGNLPDAVAGGEAYFAENSGASVEIWSQAEKYLS